MINKATISKYKQFLEKSFLDKNLINIGNCSNNKNTWYNVKSLLFISGMVEFAIEENNSEILENAKKIFLFMINKQQRDGYYFSEKYSEDHTKMRTNVIFINIELFNAFELLEKKLSSKEKELFFKSIKKSTKYIKNYLKPTSELNQNIAGLTYFLFCKKYNLPGKEEVEFQLNLIKKLQTKSGYWPEKSESIGFDALYGSLGLALLTIAGDLDKTLKPEIIKGVSFITKFIHNGELDASFSKRWIPNTPQGSRFLIYTLSKYSAPMEPYLLKCLESPGLRESFYVLKSLKKINSKNEYPLKKSSETFDRIHTISNKNLKLVISSQPGRVSGGDICSLYHKNKGWLIQQPIIGKNKLAEYCSQIRMHREGKIHTSYLDHHAIIENTSVITSLREENESFAEFPFGHYQTEISTSNAILKREYTLKSKELNISGELFYDKKPNKIEIIIPLLKGSINSKYAKKVKQVNSPYGTLNVQIINIPVSKKSSKFNLSIY